MARTAATSSLLLLSILAVASAVTKTASAPVTAVGGRRDITNVGANKEVQSLGRFAVAEHNRRLRNRGGGTASDPVPVLLSFTAVAAAQEQVVSGVAYYLKVIARDRSGSGDRPFDAVVVVKKWLRSKELISFTPSPK
ncbi:cysteine proteinase inhibitor 10-like [Phragmites australis]|uniref:cysteine proteinase inhibitor 10-like n=1 Tax=Phragmites australis TaxID=29695 RepID=UPI002D776518|nr:cysteine proteinase inhibitor 10-like [Phragmites australis]